MEASMFPGADAYVSPKIREAQIRYLAFCPSGHGTSTPVALAQSLLLLSDRRLHTVLRVMVCMHVLTNIVESGHLWIPVPTERWGGAPTQI